MWTYSTNWMGPINLDWIKENGDDWMGGRIDCMFDVDEEDWAEDEFIYNPFKGLDEIHLPIMKTESYIKFSEWLDTIETIELKSFSELREWFEKETNYKLILFEEF